MTRRRIRRLHPAAVIALGAGLLVAADLAAWLLWLTWYLLPLLLAAAVVMAMYRAGQRRPGLPARPGEAGRPQPVAGDGEVIRLRAEVAQLRADLADAREAAHAAWRDASEPDSPGPDLRSRLLADPLSGARHLPGSGQ